MSDIPSKAELRTHVRATLRAVPADELARWSHQLVLNLQAREDLWAAPGIVTLFGGLRNEPDLITGMLPWLIARGWRAVLFGMEGTELLPYEVLTENDLHRGPMGVWVPEPKPELAISPADISLILVPGLAFSREDGARLGRGGGFYDRFLSKPEVTAPRVGLCFEAQIFPLLPSEEHDIHVSNLQTEAGHYSF